MLNWSMNIATLIMKLAFTLVGVIYTIYVQSGLDFQRKCSSEGYRASSLNL
jgi:hypothetical protein